MKRLTFILFILAISGVARAQVTQIGLGQTYTAGPGEVVIVNGGNMASTVVCSGGTTQVPPRQMFDFTQREYYEEGTIRTYPLQTLQRECGKYAGLEEPKQAIAMAKAQAREECFKYYQTCSPPLVESEQLHFNFIGHGRYACEVTAFMIGTNPR